MINLDDYFFLGKVTKPHGYEGQVNAWFDVDEPSIYSELKMVFVAVDNNLIPYFIKSIKLLNNKAIIDFQDVDNAEKAEILIQKDLYLPVSMLPEKTGNSFYFHEIVGFEAIDKTFGRIGIIKTILDYPNQALFQIFTDDKKEVLIPVNRDIIIKVNRIEKQIHLQAPEGLIDIYLEN